MRRFLVFASHTLRSIFLKYLSFRALFTEKSVTFWNANCREKLYEVRDGKWRGPRARTRVKNLRSAFGGLLFFPLADGRDS